MANTFPLNMVDLTASHEMSVLFVIVGELVWNVA